MSDYDPYAWMERDKEIEERRREERLPRPSGSMKDVLRRGRELREADARKAEVERREGDHSGPGSGGTPNGKDGAWY